MLDMVASCCVKHTSFPILLIVAVISWLAALIVLNSSSADGRVGVFFFVCGVFLAAAYLMSRRQALEVASTGGAAFSMRLKGNRVDKTLELVDLIESEAARYRGRL